VLAAIREGRPREAAAILQAHTAQLVPEDRPAATHAQLERVYDEMLRECPQHILHAVDTVLAATPNPNVRSAYRELPLDRIRHPHLTSAQRLQIWQRMESTWLTNRADVLDRNGRLAALKEVEPGAFHAVMPVA
jgi:hypothetical protein